MPSIGFRGWISVQVQLFKRSQPDLSSTPINTVSLLRQIRIRIDCQIIIGKSKRVKKKFQVCSVPLCKVWQKKDCKITAACMQILSLLCCNVCLVFPPFLALSQCVAVIFYLMFNFFELNFVSPIFVPLNQELLKKLSFGHPGIDPGSGLQSGWRQDLQQHPCIQGLLSSSPEMTIINKKING